MPHRSHAARILSRCSFTPTMTVENESVGLEQIREAISTGNLDKVRQVTSTNYKRSAPLGWQNSNQIPAPVVSAKSSFSLPPIKPPSKINLPLSAISFLWDCKLIGILSKALCCRSRRESCKSYLNTGGTSMNIPWP